MKIDTAQVTLAAVWVKYHKNRFSEQLGILLAIAFERTVRNWRAKLHWTREQEEPSNAKETLEVGSWKKWTFKPVHEKLEQYLYTPKFSSSQNEKKKGEVDSPCICEKRIQYDILERALLVGCCWKEPSESFLNVGKTNPFWRSFLNLSDAITPCCTSGSTVASVGFARDSHRIFQRIYFNEFPKFPTVFPEFWLLNSVDFLWGF